MWLLQHFRLSRWWPGSIPSHSRHDIYFAIAVYVLYINIYFYVLITVILRVSIAILGFRWKNDRDKCSIPYNLFNPRYGS